MIVHLTVLWAVLRLDARFEVAQAAAVGMAMTFNYAVNNKLTYRDRQRQGWRFVTGLMSFYGICLAGAAANVGVGTSPAPPAPPSARYGITPPRRS